MTTTTTVYSHPDGFEIVVGNNQLTAIANDPGNQSEQYGAESAIDCLNKLLATDSAGERVDTIQSAILSLQNAAHPERAAGGFAVVLENVIKRGLECFA